MKAENFTTEFEKILKTHLTSSQDDLSKYTAACKYALRDTLNHLRIIEITSLNINNIELDYFTKLDTLVKNQNISGKPHHIRGKAAHHAKNAFHELRNQAELKSTAAVAPQSVASIDISHMTVFKKNDMDYSGIPEEKRSILHFAQNCCDWPKLLAFISKTLDEPDANLIAQTINAIQNQPNSVFSKNTVTSKEAVEAYNTYRLNKSRPKP